jgi:hypothetical protein
MRGEMETPAAATERSSNLLLLFLTSLPSRAIVILSS